MGCLSLSFSSLPPLAAVTSTNPQWLSAQVVSALLPAHSRRDDAVVDEKEFVSHGKQRTSHLAHSISMKVSSKICVRMRKKYTKGTRVRGSQNRGFK